jgi:hypothetical protein
MRAHDQLGSQGIHGIPAEVDDGRPSPEKSRLRAGEHHPKTMDINGYHKDSRAHIN